MLVVASLRNGLCLLVPLALASTIYLYFYPFFNECAFPLPSRDARAAFQATKALHWPYAREPIYRHDDDQDEVLSPFRLLVLADPQLEGDTSIPTNLLGTFPHVKSIVRHLTFQTEHWCFRERLRQVAHDMVDICFEDIPYLLMSLHKRFDLVGNDLYLAHIYRTLHWWARPTHVTVLGDLLGSQWIGDDEFERRQWRYWNRAFRGAERIPDDDVASDLDWPEHDEDDEDDAHTITDHQHSHGRTLTGMLGGGGYREEEEEEEDVWARRLLNVAGNHDIGYAGDLTPELLERYERAFGMANYELNFGISSASTTAAGNAPTSNDDGDDEDNADDDGNDLTTRAPPRLRIVVLNDMNLDTPAKDASLQDATYRFLNGVIDTSAGVEQQGIFTLVLTHIPLHKPEGVCVDAPLFIFHGEEDGGGLREQNLLSGDASRGFLEGIYGMSGDPLAAGGGRGRSGLILNGHDHEGCDTYHFINQTNGTSPADRSWEVARWADAQARGLPALTTSGLPGLREITVRSMMGGFGGNAGLLSLWFDEETWEWGYEFVTCPLGKQYLWWFTHLLDLGTLALMVLYVLAVVLSGVGVDVDAIVFRCTGLGSRLGVSETKTATKAPNGRKATPL